MEEKRIKGQGPPMLAFLGKEEKAVKDTEKEQPLRMEESEKSMMDWKPSEKHVIN